MKQYLNETTMSMSPDELISVRQIDEAINIHKQSLTLGYPSTIRDMAALSRKKIEIINPINLKLFIKNLNSNGIKCNILSDCSHSTDNSTGDNIYYYLNIELIGSYNKFRIEPLFKRFIEYEKSLRGYIDNPYVMSSYVKKRNKTLLTLENVCYKECFYVNNNAESLSKNKLIPILKSVWKWINDKLKLPDSWLKIDG
jgi:hypothetical protein